MLHKSPLFHPMVTDVALPQCMTDPFISNEPHPLCREAARILCAHLEQLPEWAAEVAAGKMFGVLVCRDEQEQTGFLAAYSGQILGRQDWPWFVPAVFDYLQPDGYFKQEEARISAINAQVRDLEGSIAMRSATKALLAAEAEAHLQIDAYKLQMSLHKVQRDQQREKGDGDEARRIRESQFEKAELRRLKQQWRQQVMAAEAVLKPLTAEVDRLKRERHQRSDQLQRWLFDHFVMLNGLGDKCSLTTIFSSTPQGTPPAGSGECCAPKLLQYAFAHGLRPLCLAEFWQGRSPRMEIRHHGAFYQPCRGKCKPILEWMLGAPEGVGKRVVKKEKDDVVTLLFIDSDIIVVNKPAGLLSVPGRNGQPSVEHILQQQYGEVHMVHRLDMDTSGLLVAARTMTAYRHLQQQFAEHTIHKKYIALIEGSLEDKGEIMLPLRPDPLDRPRQLVDPIHGKPAHTTYETILSMEKEGKAFTRIALMPHTGRTHQLRVHCAHSQGLAMPIVGDRLYGHASDRLYLHAEQLSFIHPLTGQRMTFTAPAPF